MEIYTLDPLFDRRWGDLVAWHPRASVFHQRGWLQALAHTYGYRPLAVTSSPPDRPLIDGIAFCEIESWITGARLVSLPFSDHAEPLLDETGAGLELSEWVPAEHHKHGWRYIEMRPISLDAERWSVLHRSQLFWVHSLDLVPSTAQLFQNLHKGSMQRRIRHAEREHLKYERGRSNELLADFYKLLIMTRRRHRLLPQPREWFHNLITEFGSHAEIRLAKKEDQPVAAVFTLRHRDTVVYKYGCSDERFHHLGGMPLLFWRMIEESKQDGVETIDLGRTDINNIGLVDFKDRLGAKRTRIAYFRYPMGEGPRLVESASRGVLGRLFSVLPDSISAGVGGLIYRHVG